MGLLRRFIRNDLAELHEDGVRVRVIGERAGLELDIRAAALTRPKSSTKGQHRSNAGRRLQLRRAAGDRAAARSARARRCRRQARGRDTIDADDARRAISMRRIFLIPI